MSSLEIAERIEAELKRKGIKKSDFYEKCGVSRASFSQWRHDLHYPTKEALDRINDFLGLSFSVTEAGAQKEPPRPLAGALDMNDPIDRELLEVIRRLSPAKKAVLCDKAKELEKI